MKPFPDDSILIVAALTAQAHVPPGGKVRLETCADCGRRLTASQLTHNIAMRNPERAGRPLRYVCWDCGQEYYDVGEVRVIDHRPEEDRR